MITDTDIEKLKSIFVTKQELKQVMSTFTDTIMKEFRVLLELIGDQSNKIDTTNNKIDVTNSRLDDTNKRLEDAIGEIRTHRLAFGDYEKRMQKVESRLFQEI
jgi:DNA repair ATPase RecN